MRAPLQPTARGTLHTSTGQHRNITPIVVPEIESENWYREVAEQGRIPASDRNFESIDRLMRSNRAKGF